MSSKDGYLSDEDLELWYYVSQTVEPMPGKAFVLPDGLNKLDEPETRPPSLDELAKLVSSSPSKESRKTQLEYIRHGDNVGVDKATAKRLTGGKFAIEASLDLHGLTQQTALEKLRHFIPQCYENNKRRLLIITGKGPANDGVLKNQVPRWFNTAGLREHILMFSYAQDKHGGSGALYVLLKKKR